MDLERPAEVLLGHRRALDVPARAAASPRRLPPRVLARLRRLPEREVTRVLLQVARLLRDHVVEVRAREDAVLGEPRDAEVDVAARLVREAAVDELLDQRHDLGDRLGGERLRVRPSEAERTGVLEVPLRRGARELGARDSLAARRVVDLVVHVRHVLDERDVVPLEREPASKPEEDDVRSRVPDVDPLVDGRAADVHADRPWRRRKLLLGPRERVVEPHASVITARGAASCGAEPRPARPWTSGP